MGKKHNTYDAVASPDLGGSKPLEQVTNSEAKQLISSHPGKAGVFSPGSPGHFLLTGIDDFISNLARNLDGIVSDQRRLIEGSTTEQPPSADQLRILTDNANYIFEAARQLDTELKAALQALAAGLGLGSMPEGYTDSEMPALVCHPREVIFKN